jgi:Zn-dependent metalloprotease
VWYRALVDHLPDGAGFSDLANATIAAAAKTFGDQSRESVAVRDAWKSVGILT